MKENVEICPRCEHHRTEHEDPSKTGRGPVDGHSAIDIAAAVMERLKSALPPFIRPLTTGEEEIAMQIVHSAVETAARRGWSNR